MIRRSSSKSNMSLVNMTQEEHLTVSSGIATNIPVTNLQAVAKSINFELDEDGAYILRKPLIKKESFAQGKTHYLYDKQTKLTVTKDGKLQFSNIDSINIILYDIDQNKIEQTNNITELNWGVKVLGYHNAPDHTLLSVTLDGFKIHNTTQGWLWHSEYIFGVSSALYRFIKIYKNFDLPANTLTVEIINAELNTFTANEESVLDVNMLLENPYAARDLYNYGCYGATKILAYVPKGFPDITNSNTSAMYSVAVLTELGLNPTSGNGFSLLVSANSNSSGDVGGVVVLKAFLTIGDISNSGNYFCCWERSIDGVVWETCPEFVEKWGDSGLRKLQTNFRVSDLTSEEFEKKFYEAEGDLSSVRKYTVEKSLVDFDIKTSSSQNASNVYIDNQAAIGRRADVLIISSANIKYYYRFQIYAAYDLEYSTTNEDTFENLPEYMNEDETTGTYLVSTTGSFRIPYSERPVYAEDLSEERVKLFNSKILYDYDMGTYKFLTRNKIYSTDIGSFIIKLLNTIDFSSEITKAIQYRNYFVVFTALDISLLYKYTDGTYGIKLLTNTVGLPKEDADTVMSILNNIYFKSGTQIYKLVPNLYAANDDILNIQIISLGINTILSKIISSTVETCNFAYSDTISYMVFIPYSAKETYCFVYNLAKKVWTLQKYPVYLYASEIFSMSEAYVQSDTAIYYFNKNIEDILDNLRVQDISMIGGKATDDTIYTGLYVKYVNQFFEENVRALCYGNSTYSKINSELVYSKIPYADFQTKTPLDLYEWTNSEALSIINNNLVDYDSLEISPIEFSIDFGQKSSNYTLDKQFLESKFIFATLHSKDMFPVEVTITTDGYTKPLHWDCNTDSPLWKTTFTDIGTLNTEFQDVDSDYNGILRQLIIKYSGKGKTIRHLITGKSMYRFKFISLDTRHRILPNKQ